MIVLMWETIKHLVFDIFDWFVSPPLRKESKLFDDISTPIGKMCSYCGQRRIGIGGYCLGCGHDRGPQETYQPVSITDSIMIGSRIDVVVAE